MGRPSFPNPLALCFGAALRKIRNEQKKETSGTIAASAGVTHSFFRLIESGRNNLSISKVPALYRAFGGIIGYEVLLYFVSTISASEELSHDQKKRRLLRGARLQENVKMIYDALPGGHPFKTFLTKVMAPLNERKMGVSFPKADQTRSILENVDLVKKDIRALVDAFAFDVEAFRVLIEFSTYNDSLQSDRYSTEFLHDVPTLHKPLFDSIKQSIRVLPAVFAPEGSWEWEEKNQERFTHLIALSENHKLVTSVENLQRYKFRYLFSRTFQRAEFIFLDDPLPEPDRVRNTFWRNLKEALQSVRNEENSQLLTQWDDRLQTKTIFHGASEPARRVIGEMFSDFAPNRIHTFNAMWFFKCNDGSVIGAASYIDPGSTKATLIKYLTFRETSAALAKMKFAEIPTFE
jgi:hypothetical protein